jgi:hypothetical protein
LSPQPIGALSLTAPLSFANALFASPCSNGVTPSSVPCARVTISVPFAGFVLDKDVASFGGLTASSAFGPGSPFLSGLGLSGSATYTQAWLVAPGPAPPAYAALQVGRAILSSITADVRPIAPRFVTFFAYRPCTANASVVVSSALVAANPACVRSLLSGSAQQAYGAALAASGGGDVLAIPRAVYQFLTGPPPAAISSAPTSLGYLVFIRAQQLTQVRYSRFHECGDVEH